MSSYAPVLPERVICIVGMHRSGTSCLTGSLQEAGLFLGEHHTWNPYNRKGNRENQRIVDLNDAVLEANGGSWDHPPPNVVWSPAHLQAARELLGAHGPQAAFGFKDPRTLLVLEGWRQVCPSLELIGIFRDPGRVADSLERRSEMPGRQGLELWYHYNRLLYRQYLHKPFPLLCFDDEPAVFQHKLRAVVRRMRLGRPDFPGEFYDAGLKSTGATGERSLPWRVRRLHRRLQRLAQ